MEISYKSAKIAKILNSSKKISQNFGDKNGKKLIRRLAVLQSAHCLAEVPPLKPDRCHELTGPRRGTFAVDLNHPFRLIFKPDHNPVPKKQDGGIDLTKITAIKILKVEDYH